MKRAKINVDIMTDISSELHKATHLDTHYRVETGVWMDLGQNFCPQELQLSDFSF